MCQCSFIEKQFVDVNEHMSKYAISIKIIRIQAAAHFIRSILLMSMSSKWACTFCVFACVCVSEWKSFTWKCWRNEEQNAGRLNLTAELMQRLEMCAFASARSPFRQFCDISLLQCCCVFFRLVSLFFPSLNMTFNSCAHFNVGFPFAFYVDV